MTKEKCFICGSKENLTPCDTPDSDRFICEECRSHLT